MKIKYANKIILVLALIGFCLLYEKVIKTDLELKCPQELISMKSKVPVISIETSFFGLPLINSLLQDHSGKICSSECAFIDSTNRSLSIDMYLYHARDVHPDMIHILQCRKNKAAQVLLTLEAPTNVFPKVDMSVFDFVISYYRFNNISWIYNKFELLDSGNDTKNFWSYSDISTVVSKKSKPILILVSHCTTDSAREDYIKALAQYIPVTSYGGCSGIECDDDCASKAIEEHYFYLAFENSVCNEYVTEKFWNIKKLIVPIVLSRKAVGDIAPAGSFIAVDDFKSAGELAMHLNILMENKEEYMKYFDWTKVYKKSKYLENTGCEICDFAWKLKNKTPVKRLSFDQNIRGNIFLTLSQQNDQVRDYLSQQTGNSSAVYQQIQNMVQQLSQDIKNSFTSLSAPGQSFVQRRQEVLDNNGIALFDYNGRLQNLLGEFNSYNDSLKNEIYNFLVTRQINGTFIPDLTSTPSLSLPVALDETTENKLMNMLFLDGANQPIRGFIQLIPQEQQNQFNNIISNGSLRKSQIAQQLQELVSSWGPQYEIAYNSTLVQRNQMVQLLMFLRPGLTEPYKSFITHKIDLMTNMTLTTTQEAQAIQSLINGFTSIRTALNNYINGTNSPILGR